MKKSFIIFFFSLLSVSCSTYVPVEYRSPGEFAVAKGSIVKIVHSEQNEFTTALQREIMNDGWLVVAGANDKNFYELNFQDIGRESKESYSNTSVREGKNYRTVEYKAEGSGSFVLRKSSEKEGRKFSFQAEASVTSEKEMPKTPGASSWRPLIGMILGRDERAEAMKSQDMYAQLDAIEKLNQQMAREVLAKIVPEKKRVTLKIADDEDDMKVLEKFIDKRELDTAYYYLTGLLETRPRGDIYYNLGVIQEARQNYSENCLNYQKAYELEAKADYLKQKAACLYRQIAYEKVKALN